MGDVLITENTTGPAADALRKSFDVTFEPELWKSPEKLKRLIPEFRAIIVRNQTQVNAELIGAAKRLLVIGRSGVGLDNIDMKAAGDAGIVVAFAPEQNSISVAELVLGLMLSMARKIPAADRSTRGGAWDRQTFLGVELYGKTLGVVGLGRIGYLTAMRARAFGMDIVAHDNFVNPDAFTVAESRAKLVGLDELLAAADFVSCHVPETPQTVGMFGYEQFSRMKPAAFFLNTSRGKVVDEDGLLRAMREKKIAGAALDVRAKEPPVRGELEGMENVVLMPHVAAFTREAQDRVVECVCRDVATVLGGGAAKNAANFPKPRRSV
jgi:D-3-phosphoglycerate dehydrogenase